MEEVYALAVILSGGKENLPRKVFHLFAPKLRGLAQMVTDAFSAFPQEQLPPALLALMEKSNQRQVILLKDFFACDETKVGDRLLEMRLVLLSEYDEMLEYVLGEASDLGAYVEIEAMRAGTAKELMALLHEQDRLFNSGGSSS
ncbi:MAG: hypothetical protein K6E59_06415 [Bacilli bacterium]|nr:hypothetical protein [Bacilli bacterium]